MNSNANLISCIRQAIQAEQYYPYTAYVGISENTINAIREHVYTTMQDTYGVSVMPSDKQITDEFDWAAKNAEQLEAADIAMKS